MRAQGCIYDIFIGKCNGLEPTQNHNNEMKQMTIKFNYVPDS